MVTISPVISYGISSVYLSCITALSIYMFMRTRTRLRGYACILCNLGWTISVLGLFWATKLIDPNWWWWWNFVAEGIAVVALGLAIAFVGSGFYPTSPSKNRLWHMSLGMIVFYGTAAFINALVYAYYFLAPHKIPGGDFVKLLNTMVQENIITSDQSMDRQTAIVNSYKAANPDWSSAGTSLIDMLSINSYHDLPWDEKEIFARPWLASYLGHQSLMLLTCLWVCLYLFVPLVRHHRSSGGVGRIVDSEAMALGVWYLSALSTLATVYASLNIYYGFHNDTLYSHSGQALDLCIRITIGPIFFVPSPPFLIKFYQKLFKSRQGHSEQGDFNGGYRFTSTPGPGDSTYTASVTHGSLGRQAGMNASDMSTIGSPNSTAYSQTHFNHIPPAYSRPRDPLDVNYYDDDDYLDDDDAEICRKFTVKGSRFSHNRARGLSTESSLTFNREFGQPIEDLDRGTFRYPQPPSKTLQATRDAYIQNFQYNGKNQSQSPSSANNYGNSHEPDEFSPKSPASSKEDFDSAFELPATSTSTNTKGSDKGKLVNPLS